MYKRLFVLGVTTGLAIAFAWYSKTGHLRRLREMNEEYQRMTLD